MLGVQPGEALRGSFEAAAAELRKAAFPPTDCRNALTLPLDAARLANAPFVRSSELESDLDGASMLLYLTFSEGLGSAALLAMAAGVPVVASDLGGLREIIRHGETGLLVPNDAEAVADAIRSLRESPEKARLLSQNARQLVIERFTEDRMVTETIGLYERLATMDAVP